MCHVINGREVCLNQTKSSSDLLVAWMEVKEESEFENCDHSEKRDGS